MNERITILSAARSPENPCRQARVLFVRGLKYALIGVVSTMLLSFGCTEEDKKNREINGLVETTVVEEVTFSETFSSVDGLSEKVIELMATKDSEGLNALQISEKEFKRSVWPEMPASGGSSDCGQLCDYAWKDLNQKSDWHLRQTLARYGGKKYTLVDVRFDGDTTEYRTFKVHRYARFVVRDDGGAEDEIRLMGSVIEKDHQFKLLSYIIRD